jgi:hypothetical protein
MGEDDVATAATLVSVTLVLASMMAAGMHMVVSSSRMPVDGRLADRNGAEQPQARGGHERGGLGKRDRASAMPAMSGQGHAYPRSVVDQRTSPGRPRGPGFFLAAVTLRFRFAAACLGLLLHRLVDEKL